MSVAKTPAASAEVATASGAPATAAADTFSVATWNVNSLRMRHERLLAWLAAHKPDVLCLQEIKMVEKDVPVLEYQTAGYHTVALGQKTYNGVAILSRVEHGVPTAVSTGFQDDDPDVESRFIAATIPGLGVRVASVYVPNGQSIESDKYVYKLRWLGRLHSFLEKATQASAAESASGHKLPRLLCGDWNIAPGDKDVYDPAGWRDTVICHEQARAALNQVLALGLVDTLRKLRPDDTVYTYWDYRQLAFPKNLGLRIDHIFASPELAERCVEAIVDRNARKGEKPSDHAPVICRFRRG